jgi:hypothetical protein
MTRILEDGYEGPDLHMEIARPALSSMEQLFAMNRRQANRAAAHAADALTLKPLDDFTEEEIETWAAIEGTRRKRILDRHDRRLDRKPRMAP